MPKSDDIYPECFGPYLRYAISTCFKDFEPFRDKKLFLLFEFNAAHVAAGRFADDMVKANAALFIEFDPVVDTIRYATVRMDKAAVLDSNTFPVWERYVSRVELSLPLKSLAASKPSESARQRYEGSRGSLLLGVMDYGCPFAAAHFLGTSAPVGTRVLAIWDQDPGKAPVPVNDSTSTPCLFGEVPWGFWFGLEFLRDSYSPGGSALKQVGLDEWIGLHSTPSGNIDEDGCYADAELIEPMTKMHQTLMRRSQSHGAHVMDLFAGRIPPSSRVGPVVDRRNPPSWKAGSDPACDADVVFVQFPEACIRDHTGVWLLGYVIRGILYILSCADPKMTKHVVINLSYGPTTGPHDGTALLETALNAFVALYNGSGVKPELEIVLAAGNAYLSELHVVFKRDPKQPDHVEWSWRLPPDNTVLCFAEVWVKTASAGTVTVTYTSPTGASPPVIGPVVWGDNTMWLLKVGPTVAELGAGASEHGDYTIKVANVGVGAEVHAYVARTDPNLDVRTGAKASYFVDAQWEKTQSAKASHTRIAGEFAKSGSLVRRDGTLNGLATGKAARLHVAGGYTLADGRGSPYTSAGPARSGFLALRKHPDLALPCDEFYALRGMRGGGNRSGSVFRLIGTSAAAPQLARHIADPPIPAVTNAPPANSNDEAKRGAGNIEPP